jgi:transposase
VAAAHPGAALTVWAVDEHRLGLLPVVRRVWAPRGRRPTARVERRYRWLYVYGFVRPAAGQTRWLLSPTVTAAAFAVALREFARDEGIGPDRRALLVVDQAGWHVAKDLPLPDGLHLAFLPAYSPELQPAERLWELVDEPVANRAFPGLAELEAVLADRCRTLRRQRRQIKARTRYYWWPREPRPKPK